MRYEEYTIEGRNAVTEAFRAGKTIDKLYVLDGCHDGAVNTIKTLARKQDTIVNYVTKERLDQMSATGKHQGVIAQAAAYEYAQVEDTYDLDCDIPTLKLYNNGNLSNEWQYEKDILPEFEAALMGKEEIA